MSCLRVDHVMFAGPFVERPSPRLKQYRPRYFSSARTDKVCTTVAVTATTTDGYTGRDNSYCQ